MARPEFYTIKFLPWDNRKWDFGQDSKVKNNLVRMPYAFWESDIYSCLTASQSCLVNWIIMCCSRDNDSTLTCLSSNIRRALRCNRSNIEATLDVLSTLKLVEIIQLPKQLSTKGKN